MKLVYLNDFILQYNKHNRLITTIYLYKKKKFINKPKHNIHEIKNYYF